MKRSGAAVVICAVLGVLATSTPATAHYSLPGASKCSAIALQPQSDYAAFDIKVKRISCRKAKPNIKRIARGQPTPFDCEARGRQSGDARAGIAHTDYSCRRDRKRMVFAVS